jgi:hypothetical protein
MLCIVPNLRNGNFRFVLPDKLKDPLEVHVSEQCQSMTTNTFWTLLIAKSFQPFLSSRKFRAKWMVTSLHGISEIVGKVPPPAEEPFLGSK